jgi:hypothetical protein
MRNAWAGGLVIGTASLVAAAAVVLSVYAWIRPPGQLPRPPASHQVTDTPRRHSAITGNAAPLATAVVMGGPEPVAAFSGGRGKRWG